MTLSAKRSVRSGIEVEYNSINGARGAGDDISCASKILFVLRLHGLICPSGE